MACTDAYLAIAAEHGEQRIVLRLTGDLDVATCGRLRAVLDAMLDAGPRHVLVDLSGLTFADCAGLAVLIGVRRRLAEHGQSLTVTSPQPIVRRLLVITGMDAVLRLGEDEHHASGFSTDHGSAGRAAR